MSIRAGALLSLLLLAGTTPLEAQRVSGRVQDIAGAPLADVIVRARLGGAQPDTLEALSDSTGRFVLVLSQGGEWELSASRLGYQVSGPERLIILAGEEVELAVRMAVEVVPLPALEVVGRRRVHSGIEQVYARIRSMRERGVGRGLVREEIERMAPQSVGRAVSSLSGRVRAVESLSPIINTILIRDGSRFGGACAPAVFIDGFRINNRPANPNIMIDPRLVEAIELYIGAAQVPLGFHDPRGCGSVLIWSRHGDPREGKPQTWTRWGIAAAVGLGLLLLMK